MRRLAQFAAGVLLVAAFRWIVVSELATASVVWLGRFRMNRFLAEMVVGMPVVCAPVVGLLLIVVSLIGPVKSPGRWSDL